MTICDMAPFGSVNAEVLRHLDFALQGVRGELGHPLEPQDARLTRVEKRLLECIRDLTNYANTPHHGSSTDQEHTP